MKKMIFGALLTLSALPLMANDKLSYNYGQFGLIHSAGETTGDKAGYNIDLSFDWTDSVYWRINYNTQSADVWASGQTASVDASEYSLSIGYHGSVTRSSDIFGELGFVKQDAANVIPLTTYGNDEDGFVAKVGLRTRWNAQWETSVFAGYKDVDLSSYVDATRYEDDDTIYGIDVRYYFTPSFSLGLTIGEEATGETSQLTMRFDL